ncbi:MAG: 2,4-dihydroxyhept-2-ene-1,7-dioic acid aldolase [Candidatus Nomurabacteria bacterium GW2011_GWF2_35_12]|uniref:2,4-dihydroxyhept-2-ene-1,7-dioic acid aldolase n=2 Tax=Candidatus Nomuraibacteriota TaxID=1752729 RepID=A0A0G0EB95_9BACT|nr:MAG: 2,4-dihydroxyhept-2-ene-1,7-dioic acid aldolase [Candidatus Nomurabacteria bacterium GW2011_GWF2_35_12]KKP75549.1 MAG: 2,4-dihydroxyhept-2-ene-1,7-dioic acid aldolase [Parcubacteria group bacterium GW2011_GWC1_35_21]KKP78638.1 MAG: 2,4-dihydroxyhept-2-ene-1,7-dioic acid aldolase [Candidatus Nomurabacteria bacterium GW2011_GWC2_35_35]KKP85058.1 MAG: 2,4-dihydroxyhept-2-ene-1,7-dioic acid aldolase [Parcubacteria group bacterium GW2011_GWD2_35_7]KKP88623.1 MAG: 2,4-dihydroxyhept-2-ene-1,7-
MEKEYDNWNKLKKDLSTKESKIFFHEREVWYCSLGKNIGYEEDGKNELFERPILIVRKFNNDIFLAIPLTSSKKDNKYYHQYEFSGKTFAGILSQIRLLDSRRLSRKIGMIKESDFSTIIKKIHNVLP